MSTTNPTATAIPARPPTSAELRARMRRLHLHGATRYYCRSCRTVTRVVSARYLPESCPSCGAGTWRGDGRCAAGPDCDGMRPPEPRGRAHCPACGGSVWRRLGPG